MNYCERNTNQFCRTRLPSLDYSSIFPWECSAHFDNALSIQMSISGQEELFFCILLGLKACRKIYRQRTFLKVRVKEKLFTHRLDSFFSSKRKLFKMVHATEFMKLWKIISCIHFKSFYDDEIHCFRTICYSAIIIASNNIFKEAWSHCFIGAL